MATSDNALERTGRFWDSNPCDGHDSYAERYAFRYRKEPWLLTVLESIGAKHHDILEVGCGQGTDAITLCRLLPADGRYVGVDYSEESIKSCKDSAAQVSELNVAPKFARSNAEDLQCESASVGCVYSFGVLHHTPDIHKALEEVHRVLKPGGMAHILVYNAYAPKVLAARILRGFQRGIDVVFGSDRSLYRVLKNRHLENLVGTALLECFGVPVLDSFTTSEVHALFEKFTVLNLRPVGNNLPGAMVRHDASKMDRWPFGVFWYAEVVKA